MLLRQDRRETKVFSKLTKNAFVVGSQAAERSYYQLGVGGSGQGCSTDTRFQQRRALKALGALDVPVHYRQLIFP